MGAVGAVGSRVVILGSSGFVGGALERELRGRGGLAVEGHSSRTLDLARPEGAERLSQRVDGATVLIVAARARGAQDSLEAFSEEVAIATNVARCLARKRVKKCLYFSTLSVYGDAATNLSLTEGTPPGPTSLYGVAKFAGESAVRETAERAGVPAVVVRPCKVYGPGDTSEAYGPARFVESILREGKVRLYGDGSELRDHLFVGDLVRIAIELALGDHRGTYNLASGESHTFREVVDRLREVAGRPFEVVQLERARPKVDQRVDISRLRRALPGIQFTDLEEGLRQTFRFFLEKLSGERAADGRDQPHGPLPAQQAPH